MRRSGDKAAPVPAEPRRVPGPARPIGAELALVALILVSLAGTLALVVSMYQRPPIARVRPASDPPAPAAALPLAAQPPTADQVVSPVVVPPTLPEPEAKDPTPEAIAAIASQQREQARAAEVAERAAAAWNHARQATQSALESRERAHQILKAQARELQRQAEQRAIEGEMLALERDVLARENQRKKAELAQAQARSQSGYAIVPYKGPNGTWRCPIVVECDNGQIELPPQGPTFRLAELERGGGGSRAYLVALNRAAGAAAKLSSPDGAEVVPYVLFVVRPDGIRPYYAARTLIEPLGVPFGYELVGQSTEIDYPDLGDPSLWPEAGPLGEGTVPAPLADTTPRRSAGPSGVGSDPWAGGRPGSRPPSRSLPTDRRFGGDQWTGLEGPGEGYQGIGRGAGLEERGGRPRGGQLADREELGDSGRDRRLPGSTVPSVPWRGYAPRGQDLDARNRPGGAVDVGGGLNGVNRDLGRQAADVAGIPRPGGLGSRSAPERSGTAGGAGPAGANAGSRAGNPGSAGQTGLGSGAGATRGEPGGGSGSGEPRTLPVFPDLPRRNLELVVVCNREGVVLHPGSYRLSGSVLKSKPNRLADDLRAILEARRISMPTVVWEPRLRFLVEPGGHDVYTMARAQALLAGIDWPVQLQVANADPLRLVEPEGRQ